MMRPRAAGLGVALAAALAAAPAAQPPVFRGGTDTVLLNVTALDGKNHPIGGLTRGDFQIFEDGVPQDISVFTSDPQPIALSLLFDSSTSMEPKLPVAANAAADFCRRLKPGDIAQVIDFNSEVNIRQTFTGDPAALDRAIRSIRADGSTSLYTALYIAMSELARTGAPAAPEALRRQAIVVLSDGEDTTSVLPYDDVLDRAKRSDVAVYAIGLPEKQNPSSHAFNNGIYVLRTLAQATGGRAFFPEATTDLASVYGQIADEIGSQYIIGYVSKNTRRDGSWRQIAVRSLRPEAAARTKLGYFAPRDHN